MENENKDANSDSSAEGGAAPEPQAQEMRPKGSQTPETQLYAALRQERERAKALEARISAMEAERRTHATQEEHSEEGLKLKAEIDELRNQLAEQSKRNEMAEVVSSNPQLKGEEAAFAEYASGYPGVPLAKVAKLFLSERGVEPEQPKPIGLEKPSGGGQPPADPRAMTAEEIQNLRENSPRKYAELIRKGKIDPESIK